MPIHQCFLSAVAFLIACLAHVGTGKAQNLVMNPSFEENERCPEFLGSVRAFRPEKAEGLVHYWLANPPDCTPDYFHACGKRNFKVPKNLCGDLAALDGEAYLGLIMRIGDPGGYSLQDLYYREHVTSKLSESLEKGFLYRVSFWVALSAYSNFAVAQIGAYFTEEPYIIKENAVHQPQIKHQGSYLTQKTWVEICDTLVAEGNEQYITIGNFEALGNTKIKKTTNSTQYFKKFSYHRAYYYVDMVSVEKIGKAPPLSPTPLSQQPPLVYLTELGKLEMNKPVILENIYFEFDKATLLPASLPELNKLKQFLLQENTLKVAIIGHTDSIGTAQKNLNLSERRAQSVVDFLVSAGIDKNRLQAKGYGATRPIASNESEEGRQRNRRVEFMILSEYGTE